MNHRKIYDQLISKRISNPATGYTERHHILPRALGGTDDPTNLVVLTGREHWIAHLLLYKIHQCSKTAHACHMMAMRCDERGIPFVRNSRMYEKVRKDLLTVWSNNGKQRTGKNNGSFGTIWISNIDSQENKRISKDDPIPTGWVKGRNKWNEIERFVKHTSQRNEKNRSNDVALRRKYLFLWDLFIKSEFNDLTSFAKHSQISRISLSKGFKRYVSPYKKLYNKGLCRPLKNYIGD